MKFFDSPEMRETLHRLLRSQMALKGIDYNGLSRRLAMMGVTQTATNLRSKINHGTLGAQLFIFIQFALGIDKLDTDSIRSIYRDVERDLDASATVEPSHSSKAMVDEAPSPQISEVEH
ncbi:MAG: DUF6471 domain-containing protein [Gammaproteobacteria bacterium]|nr:DUF6471 domain-containing protein [Gammaproteobacteria bacterium]